MPSSRPSCCSSCRACWQRRGHPSCGSTLARSRSCSPCCVSRPGWCWPLRPSGRSEPGGRRAGLFPWLARLRRMRLATAVARWAEAHPEVAELAVGVTVAIFILLVSLTQWGATDTGVTRAVSLGVPLSALTVWAYRRRRHREERRERAFLQQRLQLARELHDSVAGHVAIAGIQAAAARRVLDSDRAAAATALERIEASSRAAVGDLRKMLTALRNETPSE